MSRQQRRWSTPTEFIGWACRREPLHVRLWHRWRQWRRRRRLSPKQRRLWRYMAQRDLGDPADEWTRSWWDTFVTEFWNQVFAYEYR